MNNIVELRFESVERNTYKVEYRSLDAILIANIPAFDRDLYNLYQQSCQKLYALSYRINFKSAGTINHEDLNLIHQEVDRSAARLLNEFNDWGRSPELTEIGVAIAKKPENLQVNILTECLLLRKLPFHKWCLFPEQSEVIFSRVESTRLARIRHPNKIRILIILGDTTGIDVGKDRQTIADYCQQDAELVFLAQPSREVLTTTLADTEGWDIICFSGHSDSKEADSEKETGRIYINATDSLTMNELKDVLEPAISQRVQIAIFNSCDGLGIAPVFEKLNIERLIVMREPIPDLVAQEFLKSFLKAFTGGERFDDAVKVARQQLVSLEHKYPYASWLPVVIQNRLVTSPTWQSLGKIRSPYKGLAAFTEADAHNFYGREETIERLARTISTTPLVPIIGSSGSGKTSLIQAGLIPYLKQAPDRDWQILTLRPGRSPFHALARAISSQEVDLEILELDLASDPNLLTQKLAQIQIPQHRILLFIDQFEELFTQTIEELLHQSFLQNLTNAVNNAPNFALVLTLRNDFLPTIQNDCQNSNFRQLLERFAPQLLDSMTRDRLKSVITKPVERLGVEFEGGLADRILQDIGINHASLPLLQIVLNRLWDRQQPRLITHQDYDEICGDRGIKIVLANRAEEIYARFVSEDKVKEFKQVFLRLVSIGEVSTTITRRIATRLEIGEVNWREIVVPLSTERLLITDFDDKTGEEIVEIVHETLIKYWQRLQNWVIEYREELEQIVEIEIAARKWQKINKLKQELWQGKKLKYANNLSKKLSDRILLLPIVNDFIDASNKQQLYDRTKVWGLAAISVSTVGFWICREVVVSYYSNKISDLSKQQCTKELSTSINHLLHWKTEATEVDLSDRDLHCIDLAVTNLTDINFARSNLSIVCTQKYSFDDRHSDWHTG